MASFLRDGPESVAHLVQDQLRSELHQAVQDDNRREEMRLRGLLAEFLRANGQDGRPMAQQALAIARQLGDLVFVHLGQIRLATATFYVDEHDRAEAMLRSTIQDIEAAGGGRYLDFAYQHLGKCLAEQSKFEEAISCFRMALNLRTDPSLRESSHRAIDAAKSHSQRPTWDG